MNLLYVRFGNTLSALLAHARDRQRRFQRLLRDRPTHIRIKTRTKNPEADLKLGYWQRMAGCGAIAILLIIAAYFLYPEQRVKDARTGVTTPNAQAVLDGDISAFIEAYLEQNG